MAPRKKKAEKVTVPQLQSYIKGAIEFNADDWHPDKKQWDKIVEMIMNLKDEVRTVEKVVEKPVPQRGGQPARAPSGQSPRIEGSSLELASSNEGNATEFQPSAPRPQKEQVRATDAPSLQVQRTAVDPNDKDENGRPKSGISIKTPNVDTSEKPYDSGFT